MNIRKGASVFVAMLLLAAGWRPGPIAALAGPGPLVPTANMSTQRSDHTATLLDDGSVLVVGGAFCLYLQDGGGCGVSFSLASAEIYHPDGTWSGTGSLTTGRYDHTATRLLNGKVLVTGGLYEPSLFSTDIGRFLSDSELYDPTTGSWSASGSLNQARGFAMATLLEDGTVLVAGGTSGAVDVSLGALKSAELYHPDTGTWSATGSMAQAHEGGTATRLANGTVLVAGGYTTFAGTTLTAPAELYDPASGNWSVAGNMVVPRADHSATLLIDGSVLIAGGDPMGSAEIYEPSTGSWSVTTPTASWHGSEAVLLSDGTVLLADSAAEVYDPGARSWSRTPGTTATYGQSATRLNDGRVLIAGGCCDAISGLYLSSAQVYRAPGTILDLPLTATGRNLTATEGAQLTGIVATFSDADPNSTPTQYTASVDWGDGSASSGSISAGQSGFNVTGTHTYAEEGALMVTVSILDSGGAAASATSPVASGDATVAVVGTGTALSARVNIATTLTLGSLIDADPGAIPGDYVVSIVWGDGSTSVGVITTAGTGRFAITGTHIYLKKGAFTIGLAASDLGGYLATPLGLHISVFR